MKTKKSKPKQRTNWKQRALHCEEVIRVQNELAKAREQLIQKCGKHLLEIAIVADCQQGQKVLASVEALKARAISAEKHKALLLEEREAKQKGPDGLFTFGDYGQTPHGTFVIGDPATQYNNAALGPPPTHWQRFKSFLKHWYVELLCLMVVICAVAGFVTFAWKQGG